MFENLKLFEKIIVTGPQRTGTTICAQMIAHDLGLRFIDEHEVGLFNEQLTHNMCKGKKKFVLQLPCGAHRCHKFSYPDVAVVFMYRNSYNIIQSQKRIGWSGNTPPPQNVNYGLTTETVSTAKYSFWRTYQKAKLENAFEIWYETLQEHKFWVDKRNRKGHGTKGTFVENVNSWVKD